jgi:predicted site-specific integrase-resolvase
MTNDDQMTKAEVAEHFDTDLATISKWVSQGELTEVEHSGLGIRYRRGDVDRFAKWRQSWPEVQK